MSEFIKKLTDWWKNKTISDQAWEEWSSSINVSWNPIEERGDVNE